MDSQENLMNTEFGNKASHELLGLSFENDGAVTASMRASYDCNDRNLRRLYMNALEDAICEETEGVNGEAEHTFEAGDCGVLLYHINLMVKLPEPKTAADPSPGEIEITFDNGVIGLGHTLETLCRMAIEQLEANISLIEANADKLLREKVE